MWFKVDPNSPVPVYVQIKQKVKELIASGKFKEGDFLPSVRRLASDLGVNFNTVAKAYRDLTIEGVIKPLRGEGYVVVGIGRSFAREKLEDLRRILKVLRSIGVGREEIERVVGEVYDDTEG